MKKKHLVEDLSVKLALLKDGIYEKNMRLLMITLL